MNGIEAKPKAENQYMKILKAIKAGKILLYNCAQLHEIQIGGW